MGSSYLPQVDRTVNSWLHRRSKNFEREKRLLHYSNPSGRYVHTRSPVRRGVTLADCQGTFDIREFLRGGLGELPPRPNPVTMTYEEQLQFVAVSWS